MASSLKATQIEEKFSPEHKASLDQLGYISGEGSEDDSPRTKLTKHKMVKNEISDRLTGHENKNDFLYYNNENSLMKKVQRDKDGLFNLKVSKLEKISHDVYKMELLYPDPTWISGLHPGGHFAFYASIKGMPISRKYTPTSSVDMQGKCEFQIKIYRYNENLGTKTGMFTEHFEQNIKVGSNLLCEAPCGSLKYNGYGNFEYVNGKGVSKPLKYKRIGMVAGGTGINPMFSIL